MGIFRQPVASHTSEKVDSGKVQTTAASCEVKCPIMRMAIFLGLKPKPATAPHSGSNAH